MDIRKSAEEGLSFPVGVLTGSNWPEKPRPKILKTTDNNFLGSGSAKCVWLRLGHAPCILRLMDPKKRFSGSLEGKKYKKNVDDTFRAFRGENKKKAELSLFFCRTLFQLIGGSLKEEEDES